MHDYAFSGGSILRNAHLRSDKGVLEQLWKSRSARVCLFWKGKPLVQADGSLCWLDTDNRLVCERASQSAYLGTCESMPRFAVELIAWKPDRNASPSNFDGILDTSEQRHPSAPPGSRFVNLRRAMNDMAANDGELAAMAKGLLGWHSANGFCSRCGGSSTMSHGGWQRTCSKCGSEHFCRTDPVVIMLITRNNHALIGRSRGWPEGMYSLLAGFMEPGETVEAAARREAKEETGVVISNVRYVTSQPWPFSSSLMIGCTAWAETEELEVDVNELEAA